MPLERRQFHRSAIGCGLIGAILLWAALPPLDLWPLAWIAPIPWVLLIRRRQLVGKRPYAMLTLAGFLFWMAALHWLRLPHWATSFGWVALSFYFAFYLPAFVGLSRVAVQRLRIPVIFAAPVVWTGLELVRGHLLTGMTMGSLGHTQYRWIELIQLSDLAGAYGVSFVVMFVAAGLARMLPCDGRRWAIWPLAPAAALLAAALLYGHLRTSGDYTSPGPRIALIQGSIDVELQYDPNMGNRIFEEYYGLSRQAVDKERPIELVVWPESMFPEPLVTCEPDARRPSQFRGTKADFDEMLRQAAEQAASRMAPPLMAQTARWLDVPLIVGADGRHAGPDAEQVFNSAAYVARDGHLLGRYDKMHLVVFGEYVPFAQHFPWLQRLTPLPISATPGDKPGAFDLHGVRIAPNICYESVLPHVIRRQVNALAAEGEEPDILVNLTNDGWFWGSSELDMHLACGVFRAVECRKPFLIAANTGFSAWIDGDGFIQKQGPRRAEGVVIADVRLDHRPSWYLEHGDWFAGACLAACALLAAIGLYTTAKRGRGSPAKV
jgi:apolipoprotein N-acyltransferase